MKFHAPSRRLFLRGAGAALALPFLLALAWAWRALRPAGPL